MKSYKFTPGTTHLVRLATGDDLYEAISKYAKENDIRAASVTCLGAVQRASLRYYDQSTKAYQDFSLERHLEVVSAVGNLTMFEDEPFLHLHVALSDDDGVAFGGHLNRGTTVFAMEVTIWELVGDAPVRALDDCTGLTLWGGTLDED